MKRARMVGMVVVLASAADAATPSLPSLPVPGEARTVTPAGSYASAWVKLEKGFDGEDLPLQVSFRDGKAANVWVALLKAVGGSQRVWVDVNTLALHDGKLNGEISGRVVHIWAPMALFGKFRYAIAASAANGTVSGTFTAALTNADAKSPIAKAIPQGGAVSGTVLTEAELARANALPAGKDWPWYYGVTGAMRGPDSGAVMVDDLAKARLAWKSEDAMPCCWGNAPDGRYAARAAYTGTTGGASSPVIAGGVVYQFYYRPAGEVLAERKGDLVEKGEKLPDSPIEKAAMEDFLRPLADDVVVALDAATGKTLWKTTTPTASVNHQTHKWRGFNPTPFVDAARGTVYVLNYSDRVYALDAKTGAVKWRYDGTASKSFAASGAGAVAVGNVVTFPAGENLVGLNASSGKELWKQPGGNVRPWSAGAQTYFLTTRTVRLNEKDEKGKNKTVYRVTCHDPATGKAVWNADIDSRATEYLPIVAGDMLLTYNAVIEQNVADSGRVLAYKLAEGGIKKAWDVPAPAPVTDSFGMCVGNDVLYVDGEKSVFAYRLSDGQKLAAVENVGGARTQLAFFSDGRLFIEPEGRHGRQSFWMLDGDPKNFRALGAEWPPPAPWTTAYADMPIAYPLVDGRLFVRGFDGIYCYDLRKAR